MVRLPGEKLGFEELVRLENQPVGRLGDALWATPAPAILAQLGVTRVAFCGIGHGSETGKGGKGETSYAFSAAHSPPVAHSPRRALSRLPFPTLSASAQQKGPLSRVALEWLNTQIAASLTEQCV